MSTHSPKVNLGKIRDITYGKQDIGDIPMAALDIRAIPNEIKQVPTNNAVILFFIILLLIHIMQYTREGTFLPGIFRVLNMASDLSFMPLAIGIAVPHKFNYVLFPIHLIKSVKNQGTVYYHIKKIWVDATTLFSRKIRIDRA
jgi:hypothetical protein